jgi:hypothetical protein
MNQLLAATTNREDVLAYWDLIRQYMDVTRSLPDIPLFEPWRPLDPTTKSHDANNYGVRPHDISHIDSGPLYFASRSGRACK